MSRRHWVAVIALMIVLVGVGMGVPWWQHRQARAQWQFVMDTRLDLCLAEAEGPDAMADCTAEWQRGMDAWEQQYERR